MVFLGKEWKREVLIFGKDLKRKRRWAEFPCGEIILCISPKKISTEYWFLLSSLSLNVLMLSRVLSPSLGHFSMAIGG